MPDVRAEHADQLRVMNQKDDTGQINAEEPGEEPLDEAEEHPRGDNGEAEDAVADETDALRRALEAREAELKTAQERMLRLQADFENSEKRMKREMERALKYAVGAFAQQLLEVKDDLERALQTADEQSEVGEGLVLTLKKTLNDLDALFARHRIEEIMPEGEAFDPELHEAVGMQDSGEHDPNTVMKVIQKGYQMDQRLLRPARVIVAKAVVDRTAEGGQQGEKDGS